MTKYCPCGGSEFYEDFDFDDDTTQIYCNKCHSWVAEIKDKLSGVDKFPSVIFDNRIEIDMSECKEIVDRRVQG